MTSQVVQAFREISQAIALATAVATAGEGPFAADPLTTLISTLDQIRSFVDDMAAHAPEADQQQPAMPPLLCLGCFQATHQAVAAGQEPTPVNIAQLVVNGMGMCTQHVKVGSNLIVPGQMPPVNGFGH